MASCWLLGCGDGRGPGTDAAVIDGGSGDGGSADGDGDGVVAALDCDDANASVGETAERACSSACSAGVERCTRGVWAACDAPTDCACSTPGMMRLASCARCGMRSERCGDAGLWEAVSDCLDQGECEVAAVEERMTTMCGTEQRLCGSSCAWGDWSSSVPDGECVPLDFAPCPDDELRSLRCDATCHWEPECI